MRVLNPRWRRAELVPMDAHCSDISVALYRAAEDPFGIVHSYSGKPGADERTLYLAEAMRILGGLESVEGDERAIRFACHSWHTAAAKRLFLEACKHDPAEPLVPRPLVVPDTRTEQVIRIEPLGAGVYRVHADGATQDTPSRAPAISTALAKLAELESSDDPTLVTFPCGAEHDALVSLMLKRAQNLRAALREEELKASRGVLVAPSAQE